MLEHAEGHEPAAGQAFAHHGPVQNGASAAAGDLGPSALGPAPVVEGTLELSRFIDLHQGIGIRIPETVKGRLVLIDPLVETPVQVAEVVHDESRAPVWNPHRADY